MAAKRSQNAKSKSAPGKRKRKWEFAEIARNVHECRVSFGSRQDSQWVLLLSDIHWDNPHCEWKLLKKHLDEALERDAPIVSLGDFYCAMQGKYDKRSDKSDLRPEHKEGDYLDRLVETAVDWFEPYKNHLALLGIGNHECVDGNTDVLTRDGWISIVDVTDKHLVAQLHPHSQKVFFDHPQKVHKYEYQGPMVRIQHRNIDALVTPNHRIAYLTQSSHKLVYIQASKVGRSGSQAYKIPTSGPPLHDNEYDLTDKQIRLAAWILTDGWLHGKTVHSASITQSKPNMVNRIRELLTDCGVSFSETTQDRDTTKVCGTVLKSKPRTAYTFRILAESASYFASLHIEKDKSLPDWVVKLSQRQFDVFLEELILGDGSRHISQKTSMMLYGKHQFLSDVQAACVSHNYRAMLSWRKRANGGGYWCLNITPRQKVSIQSKQVATEKYSGYVYCLTTASGNFFVRRNGKAYLTGNSSIIKNHETNLLDRLAARLRDRGGITRLGGYGGWIRFRCVRGKHSIRSIKLYYHHGFGGGGPVTQGKIDFNRYGTYIDADVIVCGHVHYKEAFPVMRAYLNNSSEVEQRKMYCIRCGTYKDEFRDGYGGFHVEKGRGPRPLGGYWLEIYQRDDGLRLAVHETRDD